MPQKTNTETSVFVEVKANARGTSCATGLRISDICVGSLMMLSDCKKARVFQVSDVGLVSGSNSTLNIKYWSCNRYVDTRECCWRLVSNVK